ncbi:type VI secretion system-associated FHA domain protein TagH [Luteimonas sp. BDR2-5]|uniref:type VI secretion system-associated FHA domain protein TagH n=1 Tax=Proluteimonas luteida TaxID=2878685 RepID=UPI001E4C5B92|nr:type VI secretion system-associated FHA domain protein TagH [Luteimonas sp. BDR2-5]MCD9027873.1 type VI secretion system-associated FHA domain protein TagH [Luteimonas sp. BDR2-5]
MSERTLTLTIVGAQPPSGVRASHVFPAAGGSIGRADDCDWMLAAPGISRVHAVVRYVHGLYFLEDRSTNGMLRNGAPLSRGEPVTLDDGDRLQMDSFELAVRIADAASTRTPEAHADDPADGDRTIVVPAAAMPAQASPPPAPAAPAHLGRDDDDWDFGLGPVAPAPPVPPAPEMPMAASAPASGDGDLDALLAGLGGPAPLPGLDPLQLFDPPPAPASAAGDHWNHAPATAGHYRPPPAAAAATLPEEWDLTRGDFHAPAAVPAPPAAGQARAPMSDDVESILRIVVDGVMETLRARAEIKNTFRLPVTIIQRSENNPLKFAATPEEAMRRLFERDSAFLGGAAAFDDAFDDIRCHQMAMLAGMRAAFESLLAHFSPERLEREVDAGGRRAFAGKGRYWERYRDDFARAAKDPDTAFRMLFGDEFARAYEAQLARLKSARRRAPGR